MFTLSMIYEVAITNSWPLKYEVFVIVLLASCSGSSVAQQIDVTVYVDGGNNVYDGSPVTLKCDYVSSNLASGNPVFSIAWSIGDVVGSLTSIAFYYSGQQLEYPHDDFQEPDYTMTYVYGDVNGSSELAIQHVNMNDNRLYWCSVVSLYNTNDVKSTQVTVIDAPSEVIVINVDQGNEVFLGSRATITCRYTKPSTGTLARLGFTYGPDNVNNRVRIADYYAYSMETNPRYSSTFLPPEYIMTIDDIDQGTYGESQLVINSIKREDERRYWCDVVILAFSAVYADTNLTVIVAQPDVTVYVEGGDNVQDGSPVTLKCDYVSSNLATGDQVYSIAWAIGDEIGNLFSIASFTSQQSLVYPHDDYQEPEYKMTYVFGDVKGSSELAIQSVNMNDNRLYWCSVASLFIINDVKSTQITVIDLVPNTTTSTSQYPVTSSTQSTTFEYTTSDIIAYVDVIRVESHLIEIGWESFDMDVIDDVDEYRVFYSASLSDGQNYNNAIFFDGAITGVNITSLIPNTMYNIRVEASTTEGSLINVGNIQVTTSTKMETDGFPFAIVASITAAVIAAVIVGVVVVCCMRLRRSVKAPPADASTTEPVYDVADDKEVYEDLQPVTLQEKHVYQRRIEPTDVSSGEHGIEYEVTPSGAKYENPKIGPEYLELYNTAPTAENPGLMNNSEYMSLDKYTMDKDNVNTKYESLEVQSEYLELYNTVPVDNHDI